jgi:hypothetical protein
VYGTNSTVLADLRAAFEMLTDVNTAVKALHKAEMYRRKQRDFSKPLADSMARDSNTSPCMFVNEQIFNLL